MTEQTQEHHSKKRSQPDSILFYASLILFVLSVILFFGSYTSTQSITSYFGGISVPGSARQGAASITVESVKYEAGVGHFAAPSGSRYAVVSLRVKNVSDTPIYFAPANDTYIKTATGEVHYLTPYALESPFKSGEILPGEQTKGQLSYLVPENTKMKYYLESDWTSGVVSFLLQ